MEVLGFGGSKKGEPRVFSVLADNSETDIARDIEPYFKNCFNRGTVPETLSQLQKTKASAVHVQVAVVYFV